MIEILDKPFSEQESMAALNGYVRAWAKRSFAELTPPQRFTFKLISERKNIVVAAPTGSGKTMSGFLSIISTLFDYSLSGKLEDKVYCIYISPLRALNNDIHRNLMKPLEEVYQDILKDKGMDVIKNNIKPVTIGVRTGDTSQKERREMLAHPPNILVTTPESLAILLNSSKFSENLKTVEFVIVDELHELANNKRGIHLSLSIERLASITYKPFVRIGLGATLHPLDEAAKFLVGYKGDKPNDCVVIDASWSKKLEVMTISPVKDMIYTDTDVIESKMYDELNRIIKKSNATLIFTNTRSGTERVVFNLKRRFGYGEDIAAHHGSLSKESRFEVEEMLKKGKLKCAVSSTSLELGVDIGSIDVVVQLGSPKSVTRAIQRIGRAGHSFKATAKGDMIVINRDDLVECSVMLYAALNRHLDSFRVPQNPLDVLAQHLVGMALSRKWDVDEAYGMLRNVYAYHNLKREDLISLLNYLAGNYVGLESRRVYGKIWYDEKENAFGKKGRYTQAIYMLNLGTIPDEVAVNVVISATKKWVGNIEEEFLTKMKPGDIFTLGGKLYQFEHSNGMKCFVHPAESKAPTIPPWFSEQLPLSFELAEGIGSFRQEFADVLRGYVSKKGIKKLPGILPMPKEVDAFLSKLPMDANSKEAMFRYFMEQLLFAGEVPSKELLLVEHTRDSSEFAKGNFYLIFHSLFGRRTNDALSRILAVKLGERLEDSLTGDIGTLVNDNGFILMFGKKQPITEKMLYEVMWELGNTDLEHLMKKNVRNTELMKRKFRHNAQRSFMILRNYKGFKIGVGRQQVNSQLILKAVEEMDPNFPILAEAYREILEDVMDLPRAKEVISRINSAKMRLALIETPSPSPFAHSMVTFGHADVIRVKEKNNYLRELHKQVMKKIAEK